MDLRQLRSLVTLVESDFSVSGTAARLHLVQPAISQQLKQLEAELGTPLIRRQGRRLVGLTEAGEQVVGYARDALASAANIMAIGRDHLADDTGVLRIATTHTQARYVLPRALRRFRASYAAVEVQIHQGTPRELVELVLHDKADLAICTEALGKTSELTVMPCHRWNRCLIALRGHPLLQARPITLELLCEYPMITDVFGVTPRGNFSNTFAREGLNPRVVLSAADSDVIKTYVREGLGFGVIAEIAYEEQADQDLGVRDLSHLFPWEMTRIAHAKKKYLCRFQRQFVELYQTEASVFSRIERKFSPQAVNMAD
jgi:LysR family cys regulon transcriptional activator